MKEKLYGNKFILMSPLLQSSEKNWGTEAIYNYMSI